MCTVQAQACTRLLSIGNRFITGHQVPSKPHLQRCLQGSGITGRKHDASDTITLGLGITRGLGCNLADMLGCVSLYRLQTLPGDSARPWQGTPMGL